MMQSKQGASLFEKLSGHYSDGSPIHAVPEHSRRARSVRDHLQRLLNSRRGMLDHLPDYGISDVSDLYRKLPASGTKLQEEIQEVVAKYEPRLQMARVQLLPFDPVESRVRLRITGVLAGERIHLETAFSPTGNGEVKLSHV